MYPSTKTSCSSHTMMVVSGSPPQSCLFRETLRTCSAVSGQSPPMKQRAALLEVTWWLKDVVPRSWKFDMSNCPQSESEAGSLFRACLVRVGHSHPSSKLGRCGCAQGPKGQERVDHLELCSMCKSLTASLGSSTSDRARQPCRRDPLVCGLRHTRGQSEHRKRSAETCHNSRGGPFVTAADARERRWVRAALLG